MPLGWRLMALVRQPDSDEWQATAAGPLDGPERAWARRPARTGVARLADELGRIRGPMTG